MVSKNGHLGTASQKTPSKFLTSAIELAPHGVYPLQLKQAAGALKYLVDSGVQPSQVRKRRLRGGGYGS
jgi:hypothetical protein